MRAQLPLANTLLMEKTLSSLPELALVLALNEEYAAADADTVSAILTEAAKFARDIMGPLNDIGDHEGCRIEAGRVVTPAVMKTFWQGIVEGGWLSLDMPQAYGGQGLPLFLALCVQEIFDRSCPAASMLPTPNRSAAKLLAAYGNDDLKQTWIPDLLSGACTATICISEVDAGSDVNRMRTKASHVEADVWSITGEKQWISFGDHDLTGDIGHCMLARAQDDAALSLFFVPRLWDGSPNGIVLRRLEEKLGLHLSPTCALGFEGSKGWLLGEQGRGLAQMFVMISNMRLSVGAQGLGIASGAADIALSYANERRQGGTGEKPLPIIQHADVQRQLMDIISDVETLRVFGLTLAAHIDLSAHAADPELREKSAQLVGWLMPAFKTMGGETAISCASGAIQVLGGAGYTREWPAEQALRDARVLPVFEGTTGIQALDLLHRRLWGRDAGRGLFVFLEVARQDAAKLGGALGQAALHCFDILEATAAEFADLKTTSVIKAEASATALLNLAGIAARGWSAARLAVLSGDDADSTRLRISGEYCLSALAAKTAAAAAQIYGDQSNSERMQQVRDF
jgi:3-(methylthio)propanoyl-CoA dehydrogenase